MNLRNEYLSDEELKMLISEVEQNDIVAAPPDMTERIIACLAEEWQEESNLVASHKRKEYWNYCFRVWTSVAAAIVMVFLLPKLMSLQPVQESSKDPDRFHVITSQESVLAERKESDIDLDMKDTGIFEELFGGSNIFNNEDRFNLFSERNGG